ncbi:MAG: Membrane-bound lytic murein transglycosylase D [Acinetobacter bereziniae]|uniref:Membrane-bound lytic murein transglycosylase D n=1 Tax=Acinetobacter bereziniae TaxID=106648 RepID=A0A833PHP7_ACIBZ|nr:MAG: Membrane-bound lytic murein transglycosylase D [Acinetobacter bereziniae]
MRPIQYTITAVDRATEVINRINNSVERMSQPFSRLGSSIKRLGDVSGVNKLARGMGWLTSKVGALLGLVLKLGAPLLALFGGGSIAGLYQMTEGWARLGTATQKTSQILNIGVNELMSWQNMGTLFGISSEQMTQGIRGFSDTLQDAKWGRNQAVFGMLQMLGIGLKHTRTGVIDTEAVLLKLVDKIKVIQKRDPAAARKLAQTFGVEELLPVLMQGSKAMRQYQSEVRRLQGDITPAMEKRAKDFTRKLDDMKIATGGMRAAIADKLIPVFQPLIQKWTEWMVANRERISTKIAELAERLAKWLDKIDFEKVLDGIVRFIEGCVKVVKWIDRTVEKLGGWGNVLKGLGVLIGVGFVASVGAFIGSLGSMIAKLGIATGAMGALRLAGSLALLTLAGFAGWQIGTKIRETYLKTETGQKIDDWMGEKITKGLAFIGLPSAKESVANMEKYDSSIGKFKEPSGKELIKSSLLFDTLEKKHGLPKGMLDRVWWMESSRGKNMRSPAGATGHFQFMPKTAKEYGMTEADTMNFEISAIAASKKLQNLLKYYKGDTQKATAAYNWGEGNVDKSVKKYGNNWQVRAPKETQGYLNKMFSPGTGGSPTIPLNVNVQTTVHPGGGTTTKVTTPQGAKIKHNAPGIME